jgi:hypothetical protein
MTIIRAHLANTEWELFDDVVNQVDHCPAGHCRAMAREGAFARVCFS